MKRIQRASGASRRARRRAGIGLALGAACLLSPFVPAQLTAQAMLRGDGSSELPTVRATDQDEPGIDDGTSRPAFGIGGTIGSLYPGDSKQLLLSVTNLQHFAIVVTAVSTTVGSPGAGCGASNLKVDEFAGQLRIGPLGSAQLAVPVTLSQAAPNACQGAVFPLLYTGLARRA